jgi:hypothetical protein
MLYNEGLVAHLAGRCWNQLPLPSHFHRCWPATIVLHHPICDMPYFYQRCPCGAWRRCVINVEDWSETFGALETMGKWQERNSRRRHGALQLLPGK